MEIPKINESELSDQTKDFIAKFKEISQDKYDKLVDEAKKEPVIISKAKWIIS